MRQSVTIVSKRTAPEVELDGDNHNHLVRYDRGVWSCDCEEFQLRVRLRARHGAMEEILGEAVDPAMLTTPH
jgi:hypothetical protein